MGTSSTLKSRFGLAFDLLGLPRVADDGLAYLYVFSDAAGRCKIGMSGDIAQRISTAWVEASPIRWFHGGIVLTRRDATRAERMAKELASEAVIRSRSGRTRTDWFKLSILDAIALAKAAAERIDGRSSNQIWLSPAVNVEWSPKNRAI